MPSPFRKSYDRRHLDSVDLLRAGLMLMPPGSGNKQTGHGDHLKANLECQDHVL
jgi:hypothetical protein